MIRKEDSKDPVAALCVSEQNVSTLAIIIDILFMRNEGEI